MKKLILMSALVLGGLGVKTADAQIGLHVNLHFGSGPVYVPARPVEVVPQPVYDDYYYLPDVEAYYSVGEHCYYYMDGGNWISAAFLPGRYHDFDWRSARHYEIRSNRPYLHHDVYAGRYGGYGNHDYGSRNYADRGGFDRNRYNGGSWGGNDRGGYDRSRGNDRGGYDRNNSHGQYGDRQPGNDRGQGGYQQPSNPGNWGGGNSNPGSNRGHGDSNNGGGRSSGGWGGGSNNGQPTNNGGGRPSGNWGGGSNGQPSDNGGNHSRGGAGSSEHFAQNFGRPGRS